MRPAVSRYFHPKSWCLGRHQGVGKNATIPKDPVGREAALLELRAKLANLLPNAFAEVWVDHGPYPALCALMNGNLGWLMWARYEGDAGFSSRNPAYSGPVSYTHLTLPT